jgi:hypothetical protein
VELHPGAVAPAPASAGRGARHAGLAPGYRKGARPRPLSAVRRPGPRPHPYAPRGSLQKVGPGFHEVIARWFSDRFAAPTPAQTRGWRAIRSGRHTLVAAPTGSGKTLAAFLSAIDDLFQEGLETGHLPDETRELGSSRSS